MADSHGVENAEVRPFFRAGSRLYDCFFPALLVAAVFLCYSNTFQVPFVGDDKPWILRNPSLYKLIPQWPLEPRWFLKLTLSLNLRFAGYHPPAYHVTNLLIHIGASLVLWKLFQLALVQTGSGWSRTKISVFSGLAALLWAVHPLQTESVTYIIERAESLMGFMAVLCFFSFARAHQSRKRLLWYSSAAAFYFLGLGCKEVMVAVPLVLAVYDRMFLSRSWREVFRQRGVFYLFLLLLTCLLWRSFAHLAFAKGETVSAGLGFKGFTPLEYAKYQPFILLKYLKLALFPYPLNFHYYFQGLGSLDEWTGFLFLGSVLCALAFCLRHSRSAVFLGVSFILLLLPTSSFVPLQDPMAEHRLYLPLAFYAAAVTGFVFKMLERRYSGRRLVFSAGFILLSYIVLLGGLTFIRNRDYVSELRLWQSCLAVNPSNARAQNSFGLLLMEQGRAEEGIRHLQEAIRIQPKHPSAHLNLGLAYEALGRTAESRREYEEVLRLSPGNSDALTNLGNLFLRQGDSGRAEEFYRRALEKSPRHVIALNNYAGLLYLRGQTGEAASVYRRALEADPLDADGWNNLGFILASSGRIDEGLQDIRHALKLNPSHSKALKNLERFENREGVRRQTDGMAVT